MWIKICGIRDIETARIVQRYGPHAIGLNFYEGSPRVIETDNAAAIVREVSGQTEPVGLFVNHTVDQICETCRVTGLRTVQLHGDEPARLLAELKGRLPDLRIIRAFRLGTDGLDPLDAYLKACRQLDALPAACLTDAHVRGVYGGSGKTAPWDVLASGYDDRWPPMILAGGLTPDNVGEAIATVRPWGVDTSSGVEMAPGQKDERLVCRFVAEARKAFAEVERYTAHGRE